MNLRSFVVAILCLFPVMAQSSVLTYGKFSAIYTQLLSEPVLFEGQAAVYVDFKVTDLSPVDRGTPQAYYYNAIKNPKECSLKVPLKLHRGEVKIYKKPQIVCMVKPGYGYVGELDFVMHRQKNNSHKFEDVKCLDSSSCRRYVMKRGNYILRLMSDTELTFQKISTR